MRLTEALETTCIHRVAGLAGARTAVVPRRPCRAPHHPIAAVGLIGGGQVPLSGEVSLAYHGILCLDALPEFRRHGLEVLRQPLEDGVVTIARLLAGIMLISHQSLVADIPLRLMIFAKIGRRKAPCRAAQAGEASADVPR
jgi:magnesium chelatase family protein